VTMHEFVPPFVTKGKSAYPRDICDKCGRERTDDIHAEVEGDMRMYLGMEW